MTLFAFRKFVGYWFMPLPILTMLLTVGCVSLWLRRPRLGRWLVSLALVVLVLCCCTAVSDLLLLPLEGRYPKWDGRPHAIELVVVMGASQDDAPRLPLTNRPNTAAVYRLLEGVAIYRANPGSKLLLSGGGEYESHARVMAAVARAIGVPGSDIVLQTESLDTEEEVSLLKPLIGARRFAVVTSAAHMPRTMELFLAAGLNPLPAPTHFLTRENPHPNWWDLSWPSVGNLGRTEFAVHEHLGLLWLKIKRWL